MIKRHWPLWLRILLAPVALAGLAVTSPFGIILMAAGEEDRATRLLYFWIGKP